MSIFRKPRAQNLSEWLHIATAKLAPGAKYRISSDIASHHEEAVEGHLQNGLSITAAQAAALAELGDANAAARRFRRAHLTKGEFRLVSQLLKSPRRNWLNQTLDTVWFCILCAIWYFDMVLFRSPQGKVVVMLLMLGSLVAYILARRESAWPTPRLIVLLASVKHLNYGLIVVTAFFTMFLHVALARWFLVACLLSFATSYRLFRLRNKLGKMAEDWMGAAGEGRNEFPPEKPIAS
jgi:hypothetical protein